MRGSDAPPMPALTAQAREGDIPLSFAQQRLWFLEQLDPENTAYLIPGVYQFKGMLNCAAFEYSLRELIWRHEILRTTFHVQSGQPQQVIHQTRSFCLPVIDLSGLSEQKREREARSLAVQEARQPCSLEQGPLLRVALARLDTRWHIVLLTMHHIISDAWSMQVLVRELNIVYQSLIRGAASPLETLPVQYADYALWQRRWLSGPVLQQHLDYWREQLRGARALALPTDHARPATRSTQGASVHFVLPADLSQQIRQLSQQEGVTLFMTLLAAFQTLLYRWSGEEDVVVGTDIANRTQVESEKLIGFFVNLLALRGNLGGAPQFRNVLRRVRESVLKAYAYQALPFEMLVEHLRLERTGQGTPLVNVLFVLQNIAVAREKLEDIQVEPLRNEVTSSKFDLALFLTNSTEGIGCTAVYSADLFEVHTIQTWMSRFEVLLHHIVARPDIVIDALEIHSEAEKEAMAQKKQRNRSSVMSGLRSVKGKEIRIP
ncbi:condensation domain-containing protein [Ktedonobacter robiniae]|uniref:Condensation domain-containing protein n=1 Tax=Ktedonobacter robiniae TaxID=2778365 RepID=A0ABQ3V4L8_9CHLR|nr:condensation domain-containing protein [Ktedonobacter robiniae]GHO60124.1 hypothetical protein KSB_85990 [Ktedonobacter robiniae]